MEQAARVQVGIVGVSGYGGGELARLLAAHPHAELCYVTSGTYAGKPLEAALPGLRGMGLMCEVFDAEACAARCDVVFLAGEAGLAMAAAPTLLARGRQVIDLSADFRLRAPGEYEAWYGKAHTAPQLLEEAVYGMPELGREAVKAARLVANPGCHVTAAVLALAPLVQAKLIDPGTIIINSLSGVSGAGRAKFGLDTHFSEVNESLRAYGVGGVHRHTPEIEQALSGVSGGAAVTVTFTPHLVPTTRGILATCTASLIGGGLEDVQAAFGEFYQDAPCVAVLGDGQMPASKHVTGTNNCHIGFAVDKRTQRITVVSVLDNLGKGAAGQAVQNMNLMQGFDEAAGLGGGAVWP